MQQFKHLILASTFLLSANVFADLDGSTSDPSLSANMADVNSQVDLSTNYSQADLAATQAAAQSICGSDPSGASCQAAQVRMAQDQVQIQNNMLQNAQLNRVFGSTAAQPAQPQQVAGLRKCLYAAAVACTLLGGQGDLTNTSLSGKSVEDEIQMPTQTPVTISSGPGPE